MKQKNNRQYNDQMKQKNNRQYNDQMKQKRTIDNTMTR